MAPDPRTLTLKGPSLTDEEQAVRYVRQQAPQPDKNERYAREVFRLYPESGLSPELVIAQWDLETGKGTSTHWINRNNPGGIGVTDGGDLGYSWPTPEDAAQAQVVHLSAYVDGYNRNLRRYLADDPRYLLVLQTDWAESVKTVADLTGKWATDPQYGEKIAGRLEQLRGTVAPPPGVPGPAKPPPLMWIGTNNYGHRAAGQEPRFVVHHITDDMVLDHVIGWFTRSDSFASAHFVVDRDGAIYQFVRTGDTYAWTNGDYYTGKVPTTGSRVARRDIPRLNEAIDASMRNGWNFNGWCISIEYVGTPSNPPTNSQYEAGIALTKYFLATYPSLSPHRNGQLRHADINPVTRSYCPGPNFDLARIIRAVGGDPSKLS